MSEITSPIVLDETGKEIAKAIDRVANAIGGSSGGVVYGFYIDNSESDPDAKVTYLRDAIGMTPAHMDFANDRFDYGSWEDAFFMPRPCMLTQSGTRDYYLNPNDYSKKEDGTASDIANTSYTGNAMMEWGKNGKKIWIKIVPSNDRKSGSIFIADHKADADFHDWSFHNKNGQSIEHFYTPIYNGSYISNVMRSLSGQTVGKGTTASAERTYAQANGSDIWDIEVYSDIFLINSLLVLISKSTDSQTVFGRGLVDNGSESVNNGFTTGVHNTKGLFYGTNSGAAATYTNAVKVFGMENWWGFIWRRYIGHIMVNGVQKVKLTYNTEDGSTTTGYNLTGEDFISIGATPTGSSGGYISEMYFAEEGMFSKVSSGDSSHDYCDGQWFNNSIIAVPLRGGGSLYGARCGVFCVGLGGDAGTAGWLLGAALSCKPLA